MTEPRTIWELTVTPEARAQLEGQGVTDVPETVTLHLREATMRELKPLDALLQRTKTDPYGAGAHVIQVRGGVSEAVAREVVQDLTPVELAELVWAFKEGVRDEGKLAAAVRTTLNGMSNQMMTALAAAQQPFSAISTD